MYREFEIFRDVFTRFFQPVISAVATSSAAKGLLFNLGYLPPQQFKAFESLKAKIDAVEDAIATMSELSEEEIEANPQLIITNVKKNGAQSVSALLNDLKNISSVLETELLGSELLHQTDIIKALPGKLFDYLTIEYLRQYHHKTYSALNIFGIIEINAIRTVANPYESPRLEKIFHWERIGELITSPLQLVKITLKDSDQYFYGKSLQLIQEMGLSIGLIPHYKFPDPNVLKFISNDPLVEDWPGFETLEILRIPLIPRDFDGLGIDVYPIINRVANKIKGLVLVLRFDPDNKEFDISDTRKLTLELSGSIANGFGVVIDENDQFKFVADLFGSPKDLLNDVQFHFRSRITKNDAAVAKEAQKLLQIGTTNGNRLEIGSFNLAFGIEKKKNTRIYLEAELLQGVIVLKFDEADGFISKVVGEGIESNFDLGIGFSNSNGFYFLGSDRLNFQLPMHLNLGPVEISSLTFSVDVQGKKFLTYVAANIKAILGPIEAVVEDVGMGADIVFKDDRDSNLGADLQLVFKHPTGVGLSIDTAGVTGGGFLKHDAVKHEYVGVLQLQFIDLALQAFGLITTQVAGGPGYSLLALVDAEFPPVQLGWGFTLDGVGGLLAVHRTASTDALHAALKAGQLSSILFPKNAITNAPAILGQLDTLFPTASGRFLFGPMALIGWGTPTVLTAAIAVVVELPEPIRIILLARIEARLPDASNALVRINMDALGVLDLGQDELSFDAVLFDSKLVGFTLSGAMALRATWGQQREFVLAIGGFHPRLTPPPGFPTLQRITIDMPSGIVSKLRLAAYLALTSNTIQIGANLDVFIGVSGFGLSGHLGFDALLQRHPFQFAADISGSVALTAGGDDLTSVSLDATLTGPAPYNIAGKFKVHIVFFEVHVSFNHSWGDDAPSQAVASVDVGALLTAALAQRDSWDALLPDGLRPLVSVRQIADGGRLLAHPLARPQVHERLVPLGLAITRFGEAVPSAGTQFTITNLNIGSGPTIAHEAIEDDFAPAQFFDLSDEEKLERPSFERHAAGVRVTASPDLVTVGTPVAVKTTEYETFYIDTPGALPRSDPVRVKPPLGDLGVVLAYGAARQATTTTARGRYQAAGHPIRVAEPAFVAVDRTTLAASGVGPAAGATFSDLHALVAANRNLQIIAKHEIAA
jgi:hypothetical protein